MTDAERYRVALEEVVEWINEECCRKYDDPPIGHVVPGCGAMAQLIGEVLDGGEWPRGEAKRPEPTDDSSLYDQHGGRA